MIFQHLTLDSIGTDGAVSVLADLINGPQYANARYAPAIAAQRDSSLAGSSTYDDVEDEILVDVLGVTPVDALQNAEYLLGILAQAAEWWGGEATTAIQIRAQMQGARGAPPSSMVYGPAPGTPPASLQVESYAQAPGERYVIRDLSLRFVRRGRWLAPRESRPIGESTGNPAVQSATLGSQGRVRAPVGVSVVAALGGGDFSTENRPGLLLTADDPAAIQLYDPTLLATAPAQFALVNEPLSLPYNGAGNLWRLTPAAANTGYTIRFGATNLFTPERLYALWLCGRPSVDDFVLTVTTEVRQVTVSAGDYIPRVLPPVVITGSAGGADAAYYPLGVLPVTGDQNPFDSELALTFSINTVVGAPTFDISHLVIFALDAPGANVIQAQITGAGSNVATFLPAEVLNAARSGVVQNVAPDFTDGSIAHTYVGDMEITTAGDALAVCYLGTQGGSFAIGASGTKANVVTTAYRRRAALTPVILQGVPSQVVVAITPDTIAPGGTATVTATVTDGADNPSAGVAVGWSLSIPSFGSISPASSITDGSGIATATYTAPGFDGNTDVFAVVSDLVFGSALVFVTP